MIRPKPKPPGLTLQELQTTLPPDEDWVVKENLEGRYVFVRHGRLNRPNSYDHPDPTFDRSLYEHVDETCNLVLSVFLNLSAAILSTTAPARRHSIVAADFAPEYVKYTNSNIHIGIL